MTRMSASSAAAALVEFGLADDLDDAFAQLVDMGEIDETPDTYDRKDG